MEYNQIPLQDFIEMRTGGGIDEIQFKKCLQDYVKKLGEFKNQNEKAIVSNVLAPFLHSLGFIPHSSYKQKGNSEIDLALLKDNQVEVIIEAKKPNSKEFFSEKNPNCKALHECVLYYLREREKGNINLNFIIITNFYEFYVFRVVEFKRYFYKNKDIDNLYKILNKKGSEIENQTEFYEELSKILNKEFKGDREGNLFNTTLKGTYFNLNEPKELNYVHQILSREFLHNEFKKDTNALNKGFYNELLYILGLKEFNQNGKILIDFDESQETSFAKAIYKELQESHHQTNYEAKEFTMNHIIIWLNRILFLKLLEASLLKFNDFDEKLKFLTSEKIKSFNDLHHLFFEVLAKDYKQRDKDEGFNFLPYLNSSLFYYNEVKEPLRINELKNNKLKIKIFATSILETKESSINFLNYLFDFLASYDFGKSSLNKEGEEYKAKELINSSVLGSVFEKLNGYKEGSFYTPSFITSYMCKEALQKIVCEKFNAKFGYKIQNLKELRTQIDRNFAQHENDFKALLKSIKICDPAVGSGHFLVSALNEMIYIYHALGLLGFACKDFSLKSDEIYIISTKDSKPFIYKRSDDENHQIQKKLFTLKKDIIENNLFGVDINPNSCEIARLRLWIELLKHSYYKDFTDKHTHKLETLPNIDINIKCGNSLVSRFTLQDEFKTDDIEAQVQKYKELVFSYKNANKDAKISKQEIEKQIDTIKQFFALELKDPKTMKKLKKEFIFHKRHFGTKILKEYEKDKDLLNLLESAIIKNNEEMEELKQKTFDYEYELNEKQRKEAINSYKKISNLCIDLKYNKNIETFKNAFEWRFAFPEVLDDEGNFVGFDLIIGNPPYIRQEELKDLKPTLAKNYAVYKGTSDIYTYFYELGYKLLKEQGILSFITSNKYTRAGYGEPLREFLLQNTSLLSYTELNGIKIFENATVDTSILSFEKAKSHLKHTFTFHTPNKAQDLPNDLNAFFSIQIPQNALSKETFIFSDLSTQNLKNKIETLGTPLKSWDISINYGIKTGYNEAFIIDTNKKEQILKACDDSPKSHIKGKSERERTAQLIKPILRGRDIKRYNYEWAGLWIINTHNGYKYNEKKIPPINIEEYPTLKAYFDEVARQDNKGKGKGFYNRDDKGKTPYNLRNCAYINEFAKPKIVWNPVSGEYFFTYIRELMYFNNSLFMMTLKEYTKQDNLLLYILGLMNSTLYKWLITQMTNLVEEGKYAYGAKDKIEKLPIPKINKQNEKLVNQIIALVDEILRAKENDKTINTTTLENQIDNLVYKLYNLTKEEVKIIEG